MLVPCLGAGQHHGTHGINHRHRAVAHVVVGLGLQLAHFQPIVDAPLGQVPLLQQADEQIPQLVGGAVPCLAQPLPGGRGNGRGIVGIHGEIVGLNAGNVVLLGNRIIQAAEEGTHHGVRIIAGMGQVIEQHGRDVPDGILEFLQEGHAVHAGLHHIGHQLHYVAGERIILQPILGDQLFKAGERRNGDLMPAGFQLPAQQHIGAHVARGTDGQHGYLHTCSPRRIRQAPPAISRRALRSLATNYISIVILP